MSCQALDLQLKAKLWSPFRSSEGCPPSSSCTFDFSLFPTQKTEPLFVPCNIQQLPRVGRRVRSSSVPLPNLLTGKFFGLGVLFLYQGPASKNKALSLPCACEEGQSTLEKRPWLTGGALFHVKPPRFNLWVGLGSSLSCQRLGRVAATQSQMGRAHNSVESASSVHQDSHTLHADLPYSVLSSISCSRRNPAWNLV